MGMIPGWDKITGIFVNPPGDVTKKPPVAPDPGANPSDVLGKIEGDPNPDRAKGAAANLLTKGGGAGDTSTPTLSRKTLYGDGQAAQRKKTLLGSDGEQTLLGGY